MLHNTKSSVSHHKGLCFHTYVHCVFGRVQDCDFEFGSSSRTNSHLVVYRQLTYSSQLHMLQYLVEKAANLQI